MQKLGATTLAGEDGDRYYRPSSGEDRLLPQPRLPSLTLGPVILEPFGALVAAGVTVGFWLTVKRAREAGLDPAVARGVRLWAVVPGFVAAHLFDVLLYTPERLSSDPLLLLRIWDGISSFGGFAGGAAGAIYYLARVARVPVSPYADVIAYAFTAAWIFGRLGCTVAYDHPGIVTAFPLAMPYTGALVSPGLRHNLGFYELLWTLGLFAFFYIRRRKHHRPGFYVSLALLVYTPFRLLLDFLRDGEVRYAGLTAGQYAAGAFFLLGLVHFVRRGPPAIRALLLAGIVLAVPPAAAGASRADSTRSDQEVWLVTVSPGDEIPSWFGHSAFWVRDRTSGRERLYSYGLFDFGPGMVAQFLTGRLWFWVGELPPSLVFERYRAVDRDLRAQRLDLPADRLMELVRFLEWNVRPENRRYLYDHYFDNCATRVRDVIDRATRGELHRCRGQPARGTLREHTRRHIQKSPYFDVVLNLWMSGRIDRPITRWDEMFLPAELERAVEAASLVMPDGRPTPLVAERLVLHRSRREPVPTGPNQARYLYAVAGFLAAGLFVAAAGRSDDPGRRHRRIALGLLHAVVGAAFGPPGLVLVLAWFTDHTIAHWNQNVCYANPVTFAMLPLGLAMCAGSERARTWSERGWLLLGATTAVGLLLKVVPGLEQANGEVLASYGVFNMVMAVDVIRRRKRR